MTTAGTEQQSGAAATAMPSGSVGKAPEKIAAPSASPVVGEFSVADSLWNIYGTGFGETAGTVTLNGEALETFWWSDKRIKGKMTEKVVHGQLVVMTSSGDRHETRYGPKAAK